MRCSRVRRLLHLDREGELPPLLRQQILLHTSTCSGCGAELARIRSAAERFASLKQAVPILRDPDALTAAVMERIAGGPSQPGMIRWRNAVTLPVVPAGFRLGVRIAAAVAVTLFLAQSVHDAGRISALERRLAGLPGRRLVTAEEVVREAGLFRALRIGPLESPAMMDRLRERYPELFAVTVEDGLDDRERRVLATDGRACLEDLEHLVTLAEGDHER